jgi:hypothetical protein
MPLMMIRYKVKPDQTQRNIELLRDFFAELQALQPDGIRYATYQLDDKVSFVHIVQTDAGPGPLPSLQAFQRYRSSVEARCDEPPVMTEMHEVGAFRFR